MPPHSKEGLLPCPFCGSTNLTTVEWVECNNCGTIGAHDYPGLNAEGSAEGIGVIAWNTRTPSRGGEELREALVRIERFVSMMIPLMSLSWKRNNEADIVRMANDFADLRAALASPAPVDRAEAGEMTQEERRLEDLKQMAAYGGPVVSFEVGKGFYLASCDLCGWVGSSELCGTDSFGDDSDVYCPRCQSSGADCGKVAERIDATQPLEGLTSEEGLINRSKEWWLRRVGQEPDTFIGAGVEKPDFLTLVKRLVIAARTTGGTAGPDAGLMKALDDVERALAQPLEGLTSGEAMTDLVELWDARCIDGIWCVGQRGNLDTVHDATVRVTGGWLVGDAAEKVARSIVEQHNKAASSLEGLASGERALREALEAKATWFRFNSGTGEYENEYCSVKPHDAMGFVAMIPVSAALASTSMVDAGPKPVPMILHCPRCHVQHVDEPTPEWDNPPHRSHLCLACGCIWRPADVPTQGVASIATAGKADTPLAASPANHAGSVGEAEA